MTHRASSNLRDSGVLWLGQIRADWKVVPAKSLFSARNERSRADDVHLTPSQQYGVLPQQEYMDISGTKVVLNLAGADNMKHVEPDDFVIHLRSFQGGIEHSRYRGKVSMAYTVLAPRDGVHPAYYRWALKSTTYIQALQSTTDQLRDGQSIKYAQFGTIPLPRPPFDEQRAIADFLNHETAQIDAMVDAQERLVELLKERRVALIDELVARGLNKPALRDSGFPWLPVVPSHWTRMPLRYAVCYQEGPGIGADDFLDEGLPLIRVSGVRGRFATLEGCNYLDPNKVTSRWSHFRIHLHDLLISASASMGTVSEAGPEVVGAVPYTGIIRVTPRQGVSRDFMRWFLVSSAFTGQIDLLKKGSTIQHYGPTHLDQMFIYLPPIEEQHRIAQKLDQATASMDAMIAKAQESIGLMKERQAAVISAAVTGRLAVRTGVERVERALEEARV